MNPNEYQKLAARTLWGSDKMPQLTPHEIEIIWNAMGIAGEAGEIVEHVKKGIFHKHGIDREKLAKELGDLQWYLAALATAQ